MRGGQGPRRLARTAARSPTRSPGATTHWPTAPPSRRCTRGQPICRPVSTRPRESTPAAGALDQIELIGLDPSIGILAQTDGPATFHGLDAFYRSAALHAHRAVTPFVTCAKRLLNGAPAPAVPADSH
jgi:hypothetical protein